MNLCASKFLDVTVQSVLDALVQNVKPDYHGFMDVTYSAPAIGAMQRGQTVKCRAILDAATDVFCEVGVAAASIDTIAGRAGVSRQTVYNQFGDKEKVFAAVVEDVSRRSGAQVLATLGTFPEEPEDLEAELTAFATRLVGRCMCDDDGRALRKLIENEGQRYPELFHTWRDYGPGKTWPALSARFAKLALEGYLDLDDANLAARQFMALVNADLPNTYHLGAPLTDTEIQVCAGNAVKTFLRAFGRRQRGV
jgi:AcrR family transcriptional regulator